MTLAEKGNVAPLCTLLQTSPLVNATAVNAGQKPPLFAGEVAVLMHGRFSRTVPAGLA